MDKYNGGIGISAGSLMLKWSHLDQYFHNNKFYQEGDKINVFINLESVLSNLTLQKGLPSLINFYKQNIVIELESCILNLMAHYKSYFKKEKLDVNIYFYFTSLNFDSQEMEVYNKFYRSYYKNRYMKNPQFRQMGELLFDTILPEVKLILLYVPNGYFLETNTFDGSIIPSIVSSFDNRRNIIITADAFDTLYMFNPNFQVIYIKRKYKDLRVCFDVESTVQSIVKNESVWDLNIFTSEMYFRLLLSIKGSKVRNIKSAKGFGYERFLKILKDGIDRGIILKDFSSLDSIIELFPKEYYEDIKTAFKCTSIENQVDLLGEGDYEFIKSQIVDKVDMESLNSLNNRRFLDFPIQLNSLV